jgi:hypothetical protein
MAYERNLGIHSHAFQSVIAKLNRGRPGPRNGIVGDPVYLARVLDMAEAEPPPLSWRERQEIAAMADAWISRHPEFLADASAVAVRLRADLC